MVCISNQLIAYGNQITILPSNVLEDLLEMTITSMYDVSIAHCSSILQHHLVDQAQWVIIGLERNINRESLGNFR